MKRRREFDRFEVGQEVPIEIPGFEDGLPGRVIMKITLVNRRDGVIVLSAADDELKKKGKR